MTDRYHTLTVHLDDTMREDDLEVIMNAIRCIKRVARVELGDKTDFSHVMLARLQIKREILDDIIKKLS